MFDFKLNRLNKSYPRKRVSTRTDSNSYILTFQDQPSDLQNESFLYTLSSECK